MKRSFLVFALLLSLHMMSFADVNAMLGDWFTVDDKTGEQRSVVTLYQESDGLYYGKITQLITEDPESVCTPCTGEDHNAPVLGLVIIRGMQYDESHGQLVGGKVLDPESGKLYYAKISIKDGKLVLRGSLDKRGLLGRNQTWIRK